MPPLYTDPETIRLVTDLDKRGHGRKAIALQLEISPHTVRKILDPDYAERERARLAKIDEVRAPLRRRDPDYQVYQAKANDSDQHRERSLRARHRRRETDGLEQAETWTAIAPAARARAERISAEDRRRAEAGRVRGTTNLSLKASIAANVLMRRRACTWDELVEALLIEARGRGG